MASKLLRGALVVVAVILIILIGLHLLAQPAESCPFCAHAPNRPLVMAHQGGDGLWPSDTMLAFQNSADLGVDVLEMDMHSTADGALVLMHDESLDRTTDGSGLIKEKTLAEIKALDAAYDWSLDEGQTFPYRGQSVTVPTMEEVFTAFPGMLMNIEIKQAEPSIAGPFCQMIRDYGMTEKVMVASFSDQAIREFRAACPEVATSAATNEVVNFYVRHRLYAAGTYSPGAQAMQVPEFRSGLRVLTKRFIEDAHDRGMEVHVWTVNEVEDMQRFIEMGVDGIITDYPDRLTGLLGRN